MPSELGDGRHSETELFVVFFPACMDKLARPCQVFGRHKRVF